MEAVEFLNWSPIITIFFINIPNKITHVGSTVVRLLLSSLAPKAINVSHQRTKIFRFSKGLLPLSGAIHTEQVFIFLNKNGFGSFLKFQSLTKGPKYFKIFERALIKNAFHTPSTRTLEYSKILENQNIFVVLQKSEG
ncbi:hypothetical protein CICLE_v10017126mg [Citrus x clementina]|uniref:Uncharacterized protein n=1 Tax=Citrus clementina TaxID=85681 RepID=V4W410_CITCL|nr:hypothetical protein CICLE_v10017126mg [Citrus x clementina]